MGPLGRAARSGVIYNISRVGATRWSQWLDTVAVYYPSPIECNNPYRSRHLLRGEMSMEQRLLAPLRTGPVSKHHTILSQTLNHFHKHINMHLNIHLLNARRNVHCSHKREGAKKVSDWTRNKMSSLDSVHNFFVLIEVR